MEALIRKRERWEQQSWQQVAELSSAAVATLARVLNLILFISYVVIKLLCDLVYLLLREPRMVRHVAPGKAPQERHEFDPSRHGYLK